MQAGSGAGPWRVAGFGPRWGLPFIERMFAVLPLRLAYLLVVGLAPIYFLHHNRPRRSVVRAMERMGLPAPWWRALGAYTQYTLLLVDRHYIAAGRLEPELEWGDPAAFALLAAAVADPAPLVLLGNHLGALEMAVPALQAHGGTVRAVAVQDPGARRLLENVGDPAERVGDGSTIVADGSIQSGLRMLKALRAGEVLAFKADRPLPGSKDREAVRIFGELAELPRGPEEVARLAKARAIAVSVFRTGPGRFRLLAEDLGVVRDAGDAVRGYAASLERHARARPSQWFNFYPYWRRDEVELAWMPDIVPPGMRAGFVAVLGAAASTTAAAGLCFALGVSWDVSLSALRQTMPLAFNTAVALSIGVGLLGGGLDRRGRPTWHARTLLQASWAFGPAVLLAGIGFDGWWSGGRLLIAGLGAVSAAVAAGGVSMRRQGIVPTGSASGAA